MKIRSLKKDKKARGFTLVELMVSLAIFAFMTAFLLARYGTFNQDTLLTNLAYDMALTIRSSQSYGLNVQNSANTQGSISCNSQSGYFLGSSCFYYAYGVHFGGTTPTNQFILFIDLNTGMTGAGTYVSNNTPSEIVNTYNMNHGYTIQSICAGTSDNCQPLTTLDITFKRPNPDAIIDGTLAAGGQVSNQSYAKIVVTANNITQSVVVQETGEISITN
jgi:prepilin-type N-terminal cleavage/methylation domain-containing protein